MRRVPLPLLLCVLASFSSGCAPGEKASARSISPAALLFSVRGQDTRIQLRLDGSSRNTPSLQLRPDEICFIVAGRCVIHCLDRGSLLVLGVDDGAVLVSDNPALGLHATGADRNQDRFLQLYATLTLIAASVDRLPEALAENMSEPGSHRAAAALARQLLSPRGTDLPGRTSDGAFTVSVELMDSGKQALLDALTSMPPDEIQSVAQRPSPHRRRK